MNLEAMRFRREELLAEITEKQKEVERLNKEISNALVKQAIDDMPVWKREALMSAFCVSGTNASPRPQVDNGRDDCF